MDCGIFFGKKFEVNQVLFYEWCAYIKHFFSISTNFGDFHATMVPMLLIL